MRYAVRHLTRYTYGTPVDIGVHLLRLTPQDAPGGQRVARADIAITPRPTTVHAFSDHFGNAVRHVAIETVHDSFAAVLDAEVEVPRRNGAVPDGPPWEAVREAMRADGFPAPPEVAEFRYESPLVSLVAPATAFAARSFPAGRPVVTALRHLAGRIYRNFSYVPGVTDIKTDVRKVIAERRGVCQDFAHLMIAGLRGLGLPARYVSGYIRTHHADDAGEMRGADASHAWVSAWCGPEIGWLGFDPTNDLVVDDEHITVAVGRDFSDVAPLRGVILGGGAHGLEVAVTVTPLGE